MTARDPVVEVLVADNVGCLANISNLHVGVFNVHADMAVLEKTHHSTKLGK